MASEVGDAVVTALQAGYRHISCALIYKNEAGVAEAIKADLLYHLYV